MPDTYGAVALTANVRGLLPNITTMQLSDAKIALYARYALLRMFRDNPKETTSIITGNGTKYYDLMALLDDWVVGRSAVVKLYRPTQNLVSQSGYPYLTYQTEYQIVPTDLDEEQLYLVDAMMASQTITIVYNSPWTVNGIDDAIVTNVPAWLRPAVEFLTASFAAYALAAQSAGTTDSNIVGDIVNWRSKQREYHNVAVDYDLQYCKEIGLGQPVQAGHVISNFDKHMQVGTSYTTHGWRAGRVLY